MITENPSHVALSWPTGLTRLPEKSSRLRVPNLVACKNLRLNSLKSFLTVTKSNYCIKILSIIFVKNLQCMEVRFVHFSSGGGLLRQF